MRALAVARALQDGRQTAVQCLLLMPARLRPWVQQTGIPSASPPPQAHSDSDVLGEWVRARLEGFHADVLVVDVFPRGVLGELADCLETLARRRLLVTRWVNPRYYLRPDIASFILATYQGIAWSEPPHPDLEQAFHQHPGSRRVAPIVFVRPVDVQSGTACRQLFGIHELEPAVVALGSGDARSDGALFDRLLGLSQGGGRFRLLFFSDQIEARESRQVRVASVFPAGGWLKAGRVVVGGAGYQSYYEMVQSGLPAIFCPHDRLLDDQLRRARGEMGTPRPSHVRVALNPEQLESALGEWLELSDTEIQQGRGDLAADLRPRESSPDHLAGAMEVARTVLELAQS